MNEYRQGKGKKHIDYIRSMAIKMWWNNGAILGFSLDDCIKKALTYHRNKLIKELERES